jgi:hypothetical protein
MELDNIGLARKSADERHSDYENENPTTFVELILGQNH